MAKNTKRLGRGLGGLISSGVGGDTKESTKSPSAQKATKSVSKAKRSPKKTKSAAQKDDQALIEVPIGKVKPNRYQPRKRIDAAQIKELAASIKAEGLIQPIAVRPHEDGFEIIAGERRWRAFRELGRKTIPVLVLDVEDVSSAALSLIENLQREGLDPIEEALGCAALIQDFDLTQAQVAERLGKSRVYVTNAVRLLQLGEEIQQDLAEGRLSVGHAKVLLGLENEADRVRLAGKIIQSGLSVRQAEDEVEASKSKGSGQAAKPAARENAKLAKEMAGQLSYLLNTKVRVSSNGEGSGRIVIEYENPSELSKLGSKLGL